MSGFSKACWLLPVLLLAALPSVVPAQTGEAKLMAAYTLNFAKFAHWPEHVDTVSELRVCYSEGAAVGESLSDSGSRKVGKRTLHSQAVRLPGNVSACHLLFFEESDPQRLRRLLSTLAELPILTVGQAQGFARSGGMIGLLRQGRKLRFEINLDAVRQSGLRLDAKLLSLAIEVYGGK